MPDWLDKAITSVEGGEPIALVTVAETKGSVPREAGARMGVSPDGLFGTIGGGALEFEAIEEARNRLKGNRQSGFKTYPLGPELGQCCGGSVTVVIDCLDEGDLADLKALQTAAQNGPAAWALNSDGDGALIRAISDGAGEGALADAAARALETGEAVFTETDDMTIYAEPVRETRPPVWLFGAGHVGKAVAEAFAPLPFRFTWIDSRADMFPGPLPGTIEKLIPRRPELAVDDAPAGTFFLVMTHSHPLDQDICEAVLRRGDAAYLGLIGSRTKKAQFLSRLRAKGLSEEQLQGLTSPIGVPGITGKEPPVIAAAVAADLLARREDALADAPKTVESAV